MVHEQIEGELMPVPAWREGVNFELLRSKLRHHRPVIVRYAVLGTLIFAAMGNVYTFVWTPTYSASSQMLIENTTLNFSAPDAVVTPLIIENSLITTEMGLVRSGEVLKRVIDSSALAEVDELLPKRKALKLLGLGMLSQVTETGREATLAALRDNIAVSRVGTTNMISVTTRALTAEGAARLTNEVVNAFVNEENEANAPVTTSAWLRERIRVLGPTLRVVSTAMVPTRPDGPNPMVVLVLSFLSGALLGSGVGIARALLDRHLVSAEQIAAITSAECFGYVPRLRAQRTKCESASGNTRSQSPQLCRLNIVVARARVAVMERGGALVVGVTSCQQGEGKSVIAMHLAQLIASEGRRVLLVDAAHHSRRTPYFTSDAEQGLMEVLRDEAEISEAIQPDVSPFLDFLPQGVVRAGRDMRWSALPQLLSKLGQSGTEWVVLDLPPLMPTADVRAAAQGLNSILLIVEWGRTGERELRDAIRALGPMRAKLLGAIFNCAPARALDRIGSHRGSNNHHRLSDQVSGNTENRGILWPVIS